MQRTVTRRRVMAGTGAALLLGGLPGCGVAPGGDPAAQDPVLTLPPLRVGVGHITDINVCTRPFRAEGPRIELERVGDKSVIHHYGHGGSGWSLSWGSGSVARNLTLGTGEREIAVIGCGAIGLTTALLLQRAGARVVIHTRDLPPDVPSSSASGVWSPDSRICMEAHATPAFKERWAQMTRLSFRTFQGLLGLQGNPVEWFDSYYVADAVQPAVRDQSDDRPRFAEMRREMVPDLSLPAQAYAPGNHPFGERRVRRSTFMMYNIAPYFRMLLGDFHSLGGRVEVRTFHTPADLAALPQKTIVNCTGYGARALFRDMSVVPVRGQLARMPPDPAITYGLFHKAVSFVPRRDGLVFQYVGPNDYHGYGDATTTPDRAEAERAVRTIAGLFAAA